MDKELRERILAATDLPRQNLSIPEWDCQVMVTCLTGAQRDRIEALVRNNGADTTHLRARVVAMCTRGPDNALLFCEDDLAALESLAASALDRIFEAAQRLSGITPEALDEAKKN